MIKLKDYNNEIKNYSLLRISRETLNLTRRETAKRIGISEDLYSKYERRLNCPNVKTFKKIADFFIQHGLEGVSYTDLLEDFTQSKV